MKLLAFVTGVFLISSFAFASDFEKTDKIPNIIPKEFMGIDEESYTLKFKPFEGVQLVFGMTNHETGAEDRPVVFLLKNGKIHQKISLPNTETGWNIEQIKAVSFIKNGKSTPEYLGVIALMEPYSSRSEDYWTAAYLFKFEKDGMLSADELLNKKLAAKKIESIKDLKTALRLK